jgi:outer membrane protein TolC
MKRRIAATVPTTRPRPRLRSLLGLAALVLGALSAAPAADAQGRESNAFADPDSSYRAALAAIAGEPLSLPRAIELTLEHSTAAGQAQGALAAAEGAVLRASGRFDVFLFADFSIGETDIPASTPFAGAAVLHQEDHGGSAGARMTLPFGTQLQARLLSGRLTTNSEFAAYSPEYSAFGEVSLRQPLLRGLGVGTRVPLSSAERERDAARARYEDALLTAEADVSLAYWELYAAERDLAVQNLIVERAEAFLLEATRRAEAGLVGPSEVATARVFRTEQKLAALDRVEYLDQVSDLLVSLIGEPPVTADRWHPVSDPPETAPLEPEAALVARALERNEELRAARATVEARRVELEGARRNLLPTVDVVGAYGGNGLGGTGRDIRDFETGDVISVPDRGGRGESVQQVFDGDAPVWSVGVEVEVPLLFREGRGERDRAQGEVVRAEQQVTEIERRIREEVRARHREYRHGLQRLELATDGLDASLEQVRIGQIEYDAGQTTAFELVRLAADIATAQERYSTALVRTVKAAAELRRLAPPEGAARRSDSPEGDPE